MVDHRRTVTQRAFVPPVWLLGLSVGAVIVGAAGIGWLTWDQTRGDGSDPSSGSSAPTSASPTTPTPTTPATTEPSPVPSPSPTPEPTPEPTVAPEPVPEPEPEPDSEPAADRSPGVSVLNGTSVTKLAAQIAGQLENAGWNDLRTGNTAGSYPENTVYYPPQFSSQAQTLADDLGISRVRPAVPQMRDDRLTVVLVSTP